jgi:hypothetical protein
VCAKESVSLSDDVLTTADKLGSKSAVYVLITELIEPVCLQENQLHLVADFIEQKIKDCVDPFVHGVEESHREIIHKRDI